MNLRRLSCLIFLFSFAFMMFWSVSGVAKTLYIGDSRTVGMYNSLLPPKTPGKGLRNELVDTTDKNGNRWFCQVGKNLAWFNSHLNTIKQRAKDCDPIIINLGANDLVKGNAKSQANRYIQAINNFAASVKPKKVMVSAVNPVGSDFTKFHNTDVDEFNKYLRAGLSDNVSFIDTNSCIKGKLTSSSFVPKKIDGMGGIHYQKDTNLAVYQCIRSAEGNPSSDTETPTGDNCGEVVNASPDAAATGNADGTAPADATTNNTACITDEENIPEHEVQNDTDCRTVSEYQADLAEDCLLCELFATIAASGQQIAKNGFDAIANALSGLLGVGFLIYIAYVTLITIASPEAQKISKYLSTLAVQGFKVALAVIILQSPEVLYEKAINPILTGGLDMGIALSSANTVGAKMEGNGAKYASHFDQDSKFLDANTLQNMTGAIEGFSNNVATMPAIGQAMICRATHNLGYSQAWFIPRLAMLFEGAILYVFGLMILLAIGFCVLNCIVELCFVCALMGFFVACWPFKLTSGYTKVGWNMFLNVFFNFVMLGVSIAVIVSISVQSISVGMPVEQFIDLVNGDISDLEDAIDIGGLQMLMVIVCAMICLKLPKDISKLANKFAGGMQISLGNQLGGFVAGAATKSVIGDALQKGKDGKHHLGGLAGLATKGGGKVLGSIAEHSGLKGAANAAGGAVKGKLQGAANKFKSALQSKTGLKGRSRGSGSGDTSGGFKKDS